MKKKLLSFFCIGAIMAFLGGCISLGNGENSSNQDGTHTHVWATEHSKDETGHWYACTDSTCEKKWRFSQHSETDGDCTTKDVCSVCDYLVSDTGHYLVSHIANDGTLTRYTDCNYCDYTTYKARSLHAMTDRDFSVQQSTGLSTVERYSDSRFTGLYLNGYHFYTMSNSSYQPVATMKSGALTTLKSYLNTNGYVGVRVNVYCTPSHKSVNRGGHITAEGVDWWFEQEKWVKSPVILTEQLTSLKIISTDDVFTDIYFGFEYVSTLEEEPVPEAQGVPDVSAPPSAIVENGRTEYKVLISADKMNEKLAAAMSYMQTLFLEATGCEIELEYDDAVDKRCRYISIGETSLFKENTPVALPTSYSGYRIVTDEVGNVYVVGGNDKSTAFGIVGFFEELFDLEFYTDDFYTLTEKSTVAYAAMNISKEATFDIRTIGFPDTWWANDYEQTGLKAMDYYDYMNEFGHAFLRYLPVGTYYQSNPEWYANYTPGGWDDWQLCMYSGKNTLRADLVNAFAQAVVNDIKANPSLTIFSLAHNDGSKKCTCSACSQTAKGYENSSLGGYKELSGYSGAYIKFYNAVIEKIEEKLNDSARFSELRFWLFAYTQTSFAPNSSIEPHAKLDVQFAPVAANYKYAWDATQQNGDTKYMLSSWKNYLEGKPNKFMIWYYAADWDSGWMRPYDLLGTLDDNLNLFKDDTYYVFFQGCGEELPNFTALHGYVTAKVTEDIETYGNDTAINGLITDFCNAYYGAGGSYVEAYYRAMVNVIRTNGNVNSHCATSVLSNGFTRGNWTASYVTDGLKIFDDGLKAILSGRTYGQLSAEEKAQYDRVEYEKLDVLFIALELYDKTTFSNYGNLFEEAKRIATKNGCTYLQNYYTSWANKN